MVICPRRLWISRPEVAILLTRMDKTALMVTLVDMVGRRVRTQPLVKVTLNRSQTPRPLSSK